MGEPVDFACAVCGHHQRCRVDGLDPQVARGLEGNGRNVRAAMATCDGEEREAWQSLALARCPKCCRRNPAEVRGFWTRAGATMIGGAAGMAILAALAASLEGGTLALLIYAVGAVVLPILVYKAFRSTWQELGHRVRFLEAEAPTVPTATEHEQAA